MDLSKLTAEKSEILKKIEKLENIRDDIRESVYSKIREDYSQRLDEIKKQISESSEGMKQRMSEIESELENLKQILDSNEEKVEELKVRNALGDISDDELKESTQPVEEDIVQKRGRIGELEAEIGELKELAEASEPAPPEPVSEEQLAESVDNIMGIPSEPEEIVEQAETAEAAESFLEMPVESVEETVQAEEVIQEEPAESIPEELSAMPVEDIVNEEQVEEMSEAESALAEDVPEISAMANAAEELPPMQDLMQEEKPIDDDIRQDLDMIMKIAESNEDVSEEIEAMNMQNNPEKFNDSPLVETQGENETPINNILQPEIMQEDVFKMDQTIDEKDKLVNENPLDRGENADNAENELQDIERIFEADLPNPEDAKQEEHIDGLKCPKCGYINKPDLFNCEKCGSELL